MSLCRGDVTAVWHEVLLAGRSTSDDFDALVADVDAGRPWLRSGTDVPAFRAALAKAMAGRTTAAHHVVIQGRRCRSLAEVLTTWADALEFPRYYGNNLDAFAECFDDLLDLGSGGMGGEYGDRVGRSADLLVVSLAEAELFLSAATDDEVRRFFAVLDRSAQYRPGTAGSTRAVFLMVLIHSDDPAAASAALRQRLTR